MNKVFCLIEIHHSNLSEDYVQNHFHIMHRFDSEQDAKNFLSNLKCCFALGDVPKCHEVYDIRGKIINERGTIYSYIEDDCTKYVALVEMEDERRNSFIQEQTKNPRR